MSTDVPERDARMAKVEALRAAGVDPYPVRFDRSATAGELHDRYDSLADGEETDAVVRVAGRVLLRRQMGKLVFLTLRDGSGSVQLFVSRSVVGDDGFEAIGGLDLGDWVGVDGTVMKTKVGELSIKVTTCVLLAKSLRPLPDKWHGLSDVETRYRQRYVDLIANDDARRVFAIRFAAVAAIRAYLLEHGYVEVETPILQPIAGGATARPFVTHHNALDVDLYLRIAPELYLKRLVVGGLEKVFEMGRVFRNEGLSTRHNTEFTMLELYEAFVDYTDIMVLTERLVSEAALAALGTTTVEWEGHKLELAPPWERRTLLDLVREHAGLDLHPSQPVEDLRRHCDALEIPYEPMWRSGKLILEIYEKTTESRIVGPTFVCDYPREVSPFAREHRDDRDLTERFELIVGGRELANAFSELNDPVDQLRRFEAQALLKAAGDTEAQSIDYDYVRALEYGLPPAGGLGIGIDRLVMLLAGTTSIREVILFPQLRPEVGEQWT
ncbi:MAG: lysyl-tRNA synthetase, class [Actinomycetota bacterium]|jgi:lysyl-tRNA synthetase class 2|nr:lysyl-tRNA synthetase, class [Actinomycetota bacterium]